MPRISPRVIRTARALHPHLAQLLPVCRDFRSAQNELRWIRESVPGMNKDESPDGYQSSIAALVRRRALGEPLQYILGNEFFGGLELKCTPGVLIPRPETAASVTYLVDRVTAKLDRKSISTRRRILDICTGTGCIPLLFHDEFYKRREVQHVPLDIRGYDISPAALRLAEENRAMQLARPENISSRLSDPSERVKCLQNTKFFHYDLSSGISHGATDGSGSEPGQDFCSSSAAKSSCIPSTCDILISNPPYIPLQEYYRTTARSVRNFEPRLALVPPGANHRHHHGSARNIDQGDLFYPHLLALAERLSAKFVLLEVADAEQARRVVAMALQLSWNVDVEIWHDEPSVDRRDEIKVDGHNIRIVGEGNGRSVFIRRKEFEGLGSDVFPDTERVRT